MESSLLKVLLVVTLFASVHGFCGRRKLNGDLTRAAVKAAEWLKHQMDESGSFGMGHLTAHAYHTLRLLGHDGKNGSEILGKELTTQGLGSITGGRLALYVLGAVSLCEDPRQFQQQDLVKALKTKLTKFPSAGFDNYYQYSLALLALCSAGVKISERYVKIGVAPSLGSDVDVDTLSMGIMSMSCFYQKHKDRKLKVAIKAAAKHLRRIQMENEGRFGNEISTSNAVMALLAANVKRKLWNCTSTMEFLLSMQHEDGSFGGVYNTIQTLPGLIGALPYDVADLSCPKVAVAKPKEITVCVKLEFDQSIVVDKSAPPPEYFTVLNGTNTHDILKMAKQQHPCYDFTLKKTSFGHMITSVCGVSHDPKRQLYWMMYTAPGKPASYGIDELKPLDGSCVIFKFMKLRQK